ncbi:MAG: hypothetical protein QOK39_1816, partial [Acidimicrobiaceae bacterium]|nr:hypothetical protein [Acidimicrobiaceae bacterium]
MATLFEAYPGDFPDPAVIRSGPTYYAYATNAGPDNIQLLESGDLLAWAHLGDAVPILPAWAVAGKTWAPSVVELAAGGFVLYYTLSEAASGRQ